jgi:hypothetical protein
MITDIALGLALLSAIVAPAMIAMRITKENRNDIA